VTEPKRRRVFVDAHPFFRCHATVRVGRSQETAQCGRSTNRAYDQHGALAGLCTQHAEMLHKGKPVIKFSAKGAK
jgi:hypothetical protein